MTASITGHPCVLAQEFFQGRRPQVPRPSPWPSLLRVGGVGGCVLHRGWIVSACIPRRPNEMSFIQRPRHAPGKQDEWNRSTGECVARNAGILLMKFNFRTVHEVCRTCRGPGGGVHGLRRDGRGPLPLPLLPSWGGELQKCTPLKFCGRTVLPRERLEKNDDGIAVKDCMNVLPSN